MLNLDSIYHEQFLCTRFHKETSNSIAGCWEYIGPKLKINLLPLTWPCQNRLTEFFLLEICRHFLFLILLKIPYFIFVSPKDRYFHITEHIFVVKKKKKPTYPLTSKIVGPVRGNRNIFNCGLVLSLKK